MLEPTLTLHTRVRAGENPWASNSGNRGWFVLPRRGVKKTKKIKARTIFIYNLFPRNTRGMRLMRRKTPLKTLLKKTLSHLASTISNELRIGPQSRVKLLPLHVNQSPTDQRTGPSRRGKPVDCNLQIHASNHLTSKTSYTLIYKLKPIGLLPPHTPIKRTKINQYEPTTLAHYTCLLYTSPSPRD